MSVFKSEILAGRVALVTGGGSGICKGIAQAFLEHGSRVAIVSRKTEILEATARELGREVLAVTADVRQPEAVERAVEQTTLRFGRLDTVVNGAAGNFLSPAATLSPNGFKTVVDIDLCGTFNVSRAAFAALKQAGDGVVINISATLHYGGTPLQAHAASAKAGVDALTRTLAAEWGGSGIRVNAIAPGPIEDTEGMRRLLSPELRDRLLRGIPVGRLGTIEDVANLAVFLASPAAHFITGAVFVVDGGESLRVPAHRLS